MHVTNFKASFFFYPVFIYPNLTEAWLSKWLVLMQSFHWSCGVAEIFYFNSTLRDFCDFQDGCIKLLYLDFLKLSFLAGVIIKIQEKKVIAWLRLRFYTVYWIDQ